MGCNGCTDCCKAVALDKMGREREKSLKDSGSIPEGWERISKRSAKKRNPYMFKGTKWSKKTFFKCNHLTEQGCGIHATSPYVCSGYPYYGRTLEVNKEYAEYCVNEYSPSCNLWKEVTNIKTEDEYDKFVLGNFSNFVDRFEDKLHKSRDQFLNLIPTVEV